MPTSVFSDYSDYVISQLKTDGLVYITTDTFANINTNYPAASNPNCMAKCSDMNNIELVSNGPAWIPKNNISNVKFWSYVPYIIAGFGSAGTASYSQVGATVTVTWNSHTFTSEDCDGGAIYLPANTGGLLSGWYTNFLRVDANTFTCTSTISQTISGLLGTNVSETFLPTTYTFPTNVFRDGLGTQVFVTAKSLAVAGTKTLKTYFNNIVTLNTSIATSGVWVTTNPAPILFTSPTRYFFSASTITPRETLVTPITTISGQVTTNTTWFIISPSCVTLVNRM